MGPWVGLQTCQNTSFNHTTVRSHVQQDNAIYRDPLHILGTRGEKQYKMLPYGFITVWKVRKHTSLSILLKKKQKRFMLSEGQMERWRRAVKRRGRAGHLGKEERAGKRRMS